MAVTTVVVTCPECDKRFKPKGDVQGKRIKCPFCKEAFVVPAAKASKAAKAKKAAVEEQAEESAALLLEMTPEEKAAADAQAAEAERQARDAEFDDKSAYNVNQEKLVPRCPNCTFEMGPNDIICLKCGYNTLTREWGKTEKVVALTWERHLKHLGPALGAAAFVLFSVIGLVYFCILVPYDVAGTWMVWLFDTEAVRMWGSVIFLMWLFGAGNFCIKKFIEKPKPPVILVEETD